MGISFGKENKESHMGKKFPNLNYQFNQNQGLNYPQISNPTNYYPEYHPTIQSMIISN